MPSSAGRSAAVPLDSVDVQPTLINVPVVRQTLERNFPPRLRDTGRSGTVGMSFRVDEEGVPSEFHVVRSSGYPDMDAAAIKVAEAMRFTPATKGGSPVSARVQMPITFRSQEGSSWRQE
jgi:protein TonB